MNWLSTEFSVINFSKLHSYPAAQYAQQGYAISRVYIYIYMCVFVCMSQKIARLASTWSKKSAQEAFFSHLNIVNVTLDCQFTPGWALLLFLCLHLCAPSGLRGPWGAHTCSMIGRCARCVVTPTTMCKRQQAGDDYVVCCWYLQCSNYLIDRAQRAQGMCSVKLDSIFMLRRHTGINNEKGGVIYPCMIRACG